MRETLSEMACDESGRAVKSNSNQLRTLAATVEVRTHLINGFVAGKQQNQFLARSSFFSVESSTFAGLWENLDDSDRKSTPLNSNHLVISYAVFCFKKKNIKPL